MKPTARWLLLLPAALLLCPSLAGARDLRSQTGRRLASPGVPTVRLQRPPHLRTGYKRVSPLLLLFAINKSRGQDNREALRNAAIGAVAGDATRGIANPVARAVVSNAVQKRLRGENVTAEDHRQAARRGAAGEIARQATAGVENPVLRRVVSGQIRDNLLQGSRGSSPGSR